MLQSVIAHLWSTLLYIGYSPQIFSRCSTLVDFKKNFGPKCWFSTRFHGYASVRPFLYFGHFHIFDLFCTSTHWLYFDQNCTSTCTFRQIRSPDLTKGRSKEFEVRESKYRKGRTDAYPFPQLINIHCDIVKRNFILKSSSVNILSTRWRNIIIITKFNYKCVI